MAAAATPERTWAGFVCAVLDEALQSTSIAAAGGALSGAVYAWGVPGATPETSEQFGIMVAGLLLAFQTYIPRFEAGAGLAKLTSDGASYLSKFSWRGLNALAVAAMGFGIAELMREAVPPHETVAGLEGNAASFPLALVTIEIMKDAARAGAMYFEGGPAAEFWSAVVAELGTILGVVPYILSGTTGHGADTSVTQHVANAFAAAIATVVIGSQTSEFVRSYARRCQEGTNQTAYHALGDDTATDAAHTSTGGAQTAFGDAAMAATRPTGANAISTKAIGDAPVV